MIYLDNLSSRPITSEHLSPASTLKRSFSVQLCTARHSTRHSHTNKVIYTEEQTAAGLGLVVIEIVFDPSALMLSSLIVIVPSSLYVSVTVELFAAAAAAPLLMARR